MSEPPLTHLLDQSRQGDAEATRLLVQHYAQKLMRLAHKHLAARTRQRADTEDIVQSVFKSFFFRDSKGQFRIDSSDDLWGLLVTITVRKARSIWRKNTAGKRNVHDEVSHSEPAEALLLSALSREPSIVEALSLADEVENLLDGLSETHAQALELRLAGFNYTEAAAIMNISRQALYRLMESLQLRLRQRLDNVA